MKANRFILALSVLLMSILACNAPGGIPAYLAATLTAQALGADLPPTGPPTATDTPPGVVTLKPSTPQVSVTVATNCRTGPGQAYDQVFGLNPGESAEIVGRYPPANYLLIKWPGGTCWLWGQYAVITGDISGLPVFPVPPTPTPGFTNTPKFTKTPKPSATPAPPKAPSGLSGAYDRTCAGGFRGLTPIWIEDVTLTWTDNADNETGYRMYKNGSALPDFPANSTSFHITLRYDQGTGGALFDNFAVEAFNGAGASSKIAVDVPRCP